MMCAVVAERHGTMTLSDLTITPARPADLPAILTMIKALSAFHGDDAAANLSDLQDMFFGPTDRATALIATSDGTPVGYAGLTPTMVIHDAKLRLDIHHLYVTQTHRAKGVGTALITAARSHAIAVGATRLTIGTDASNATAIASYRAMNILEEITGTGPRFRVDLTG